MHIKYISAGLNDLIATSTAECLEKATRLSKTDDDPVNSLWPSDAIWRQEIWVNIGSGNGLLPDGTKPLPEPILTYHYQGPVIFI